ncbi:MAG: Ig-like domain-containing protein [Oscillospiraceae bacterium]|nr:Ig-like domain-containing protein [Oscillospiraceae bacterium]
MNTIKCPVCGEEYSTTYKRCPFCEERDYAEKHKNGKKMGRGPNRKRSPLGTIASFLISFAIIVAAVLIVASIGRRLFSEKNPAETAPAVSGASSPPQSSGTGAQANVTGITLNKTDITLFSAGETYQLTADVAPHSAGASVTWTSENPAVATVSSTGLVTAVSGGDINVTAQAGQKTEFCVVRVKAPAAAGSTAAGQTPALNRTDITLDTRESFRLSVSGGSGGVSWSVNNPSVATVTSSGLVTGLSPGRTAINASVDGRTLTCTVRVS